MPKYIIDYLAKFLGTVEVEAKTQEEAEEKFFSIRTLDLVISGELDSQEEREVFDIQEKS